MRNYYDSSGEHEIIKLMKESEESKEIIEMVSRLGANTPQTYEERYQIVNKSRDEGNFEYFQKIAELAGSHYKFYFDTGDEWDGCRFFGGYLYDFEFFLNLSRFYKENDSLFAGHFDIISRFISKNCSTRYNWKYKEIKDFWIDITYKNKK